MKWENECYRKTLWQTKTKLKFTANVVLEITFQTCFVLNSRISC